MPPSAALPAPSQNFVYADVDGNIGYAMSGLLPIRSGGDGATPSSGPAGDGEWIGTINPADLPAIENPPGGALVTANNDVDPSSPYFITKDWVAPFRAQRIEQMLDNDRRLDLRAFEGMQADINSLAARFILAALGADTPEKLRGWDCRVDGGETSAFYEAFEAAMWRRTFSDDMSPALFDRFYRYAANERFAGLFAIVRDPHSPWFDDRTTAVRETRADIARLSAADADRDLQTRFDGGGRRWDRIHAARFPHALGGGGLLLDWFFSRGPVPVAGDGMTVDKTTTNLRRPVLDFRSCLVSTDTGCGRLGWV